ncbi:MAG: PepSY domain-containing protein [Pirellulales bacterium]
MSTITPETETHAPSPDRGPRKTIKLKPLTNPGPRPRDWDKTFNLWIRRIHLYSGLLLLPWVFLYGVTGFLFNHPTFFASSDTIFFSPGETVGTPIERLPKPEETAARVLASINAGEQKYELVPDTVNYGRGGLRVSFSTAEGKPMALTLDPVAGGGSIRAAQAGRAGGGEAMATKGGEKGRAATNGDDAKSSEGRRRGKEASKSETKTEATEQVAANGDANATAVDDEGKNEAPRGRGAREGGRPMGRGGEGARTATRREPAPFARDEFALDVSPRSIVADGATALLTNLGYADVTNVRTEVVPLTFKMTSAGKTWSVNYNEELGTLSGEEIVEREAPGMPFRQFLLRLHMTHHYPSSFGVRWVFAVIVDVMAMTMVFWGVSGVLMWIQIKKTRLIGAVVLLLAMISVAAIGPLMYEAISSAGR